MTHTAFNEASAYCDAVRRQVDALADRIFDMERRVGSVPGAGPDVEGDLLRIEALLARTQFEVDWRPIAAELDDAVEELRSTVDIT